MIDRRRFIGTTVAGGLGLTAATPGCAPRQSGQSAAEMSTEEARVPSFELDEVTVVKLQRAMESGERTARSITELYLGRIDAMNQRGPELRAIIETNPRRPRRRARRRATR